MTRKNQGLQTQVEQVAPFSSYLRPSLQKRMKRLAVELETTTATLLNQALEEFLANHEHKPES